MGIHTNPDIIIRDLDDGLRLVELTGEHDLAGVERIRAAVDGSGTVIVDMTRATFIDSSVLSAITGSMEKRPGRIDQIRLVAPPGGAPRRLLDLVRIPDLVATFDDLAAALAWDGGAPVV